MINKNSLIVLILLSFIIFLDNGNRYNLELIFIYFSIVVISTTQIFSNKALPFSLHNIFNLFFLFFIGISPVIQYNNNIVFLNKLSSLNDLDYIKGGVFYLVILLVYNILYNKIFNKNNNELSIKKRWTFNFYYDKKILLLLSIFTSLLILIYFNFNLDILISRKSLILFSRESYKPLTSVVNTLRLVPLFSLLFLKLSNKNNIKLEVTLLLLTILLNIPTSIPRFKVAVVYLPLLFVYFKPIYIKNTFNYIFSIGLMIVFPYLHHYRYNHNIYNNPFKTNVFNDAHFDSFQNSINLIKHCSITYGEQLLAIILFFVPSDLWTSKPLNSNKILVKSIDYDGFSNIAIGYFAEGYLNFGYIGVILFIILIAFLNAYIDKKFWSNNKKKSIFILIYFILLPFEFILLRGSLRALFANLIGSILLIYLIYILLNHKNIKKLAKN